MEEKEPAQKLIEEGLRGYFPVLNAIKAFEQQLHTMTEQVLLDCVSMIEEAGCYVKKPPATWRVERTIVEGEIALGVGLETSSAEKDSQLRWSGIYCGVAWVRGADRALDCSPLPAAKYG
jgi:hypothetical protein